MQGISLRQTIIITTTALIICGCGDRRRQAEVASRTIGVNFTANNAAAYYQVNAAASGTECAGASFAGNGVWHVEGGGTKIGGFTPGCNYSLSLQLGHKSTGNFVTAFQTATNHELTAAEINPDAIIALNLVAIDTLPKQEIKVRDEEEEEEKPSESTDAEIVVTLPSELVDN